MNKADVINAISETAKLGGALSADEAVNRLAELVVGLDPARPSYVQDMDTLLGIGAHIWQRRRG